MKYKTITVNEEYRVSPVKTFSVMIIDQLQPILVGLRKSKGLTQQAVADKLGITQQSYAALESHPEVVSVGRLYAVLSLLGARFIIFTGQEKKENIW